MQKNFLNKKLRIGFWILAVLLGAIHAYANRHAMNPDGIAFLDMAEATLRRDWHVAINSYWSPLYAWILAAALFFLKPSPYWEFATAHLVNFFIYIFALAGFDFLLQELILTHRQKGEKLEQQGFAVMPEWGWILLGYLLFLWFSLTEVTLQLLFPDMLLTAFVYLAAGLLLRIQREPDKWVHFPLLGLVLGTGYLAKAPLFPLAFVFFLIAALRIDNFKKAVPRIAMGLAGFFLVAVPFIYVISKHTGRLTFGDAGRLHYAWLVNGVSQYIDWGGKDTTYGIPKHPVNKILEKPAVLEFGSFNTGGTFPPGYKTAFWYEGVTPRFQLKGQLRTILEAIKLYYYYFFTIQIVLVVGFFVLLYAGHRRKHYLKDLNPYWVLVFPAVAAFLMYALVRPQFRYLGSFCLIFWLGIFAAFRLPNHEGGKNLFRAVLMGMAAVLCITLVFSSDRETITSLRDLLRGEDRAAHLQWQIADHLRRLGIQPEDKVASIGYSSAAYWAKIGRVQIVSEIDKRSQYDFWAADSQTKDKALQALASTGAKAVVAADVPDYFSTKGWQRIGKTDYYIRLLR